MSKKYFGTDGIRGRANSTPMTSDIALRLGRAVGYYFRTDAERHRIVIGKDTRLSGYMIEASLMAGFTSMGMDVFLLGPVPTPAVGMLTRSLRADLGVMISASHNPFYDNGIKLFGPDGFKLSDEAENKIEQYIDHDLSNHLADSNKLGRIQRLEDGRARYIEFAKSTFPKNLRLDGMKIVIDCAHGAAYKTAPDVLWELGAELIKIGVQPNGTNINDNCGSTSPEHCQAAVIQNRAHLGIALDGDADRVHIIDEKGQIVDGDQIMAVITQNMHDKKLLRGKGLVSTVMSNLGLEKYLESIGLNLYRTQVGDRYVVERMRKDDCNIGGEQSGHVVLSDFVTTGDGIIAALQVLAVLVETGKPASEVCSLFRPYPQMLKNVRYNAKSADPLKDAEVKKVIAVCEKELSGEGRLLIRKSGTEPVIRVMAEGPSSRVVGDITDRICAKIQEVSKQ